ncbi:hypothetical protein FPSE_04919 [Fusarium pseudograminearum CS3096]|uniref:Uncharacterized protein n=1 Tax=Fusarium pseudograminearum (strain CS3096) TaxID=1028729 RepID=K3VMK5_FUSPC|nr:hypothetical protein FPSE_04919 [Fusarium pseudograminearum CS3096]EKJ74883.1 hypothetical protein FPSE_04919 [Fusarium pseudograminearum CS3096]
MSSEEVARADDLARVISDSQSGLARLQYHLAISADIPGAIFSSFDDISPYVVDNNDPTVLGVALSAEYINMPRSLFDTSGLGVQTGALSSRRVLLSGLPGSATVAQVAGGVAAMGGIVSIFVNRDLRAGTLPGQLSAIIEFVFSVDAARYVHFVATHGIWFVDMKGLHHEVSARHILTPSNTIVPIHPRNCDIDDNGLSGRCIRLEAFPIIAVWALLKDFGIRHIVRSEITLENDCATKGHLHIEFTNVFESTRMCGQLLGGRFYHYRPTPAQISLAWCPSDRDVEEIGITIIAHVDNDEVESHWNRRPFNWIIPTQFGARLISSTPTSQEATVTILGDDGQLRSIPHTEVTASMRANGTNYILLGDTIYAGHPITLNNPHGVHNRVFGPALVRMKKLYVLAPGWESFWDELSKAQGINIRAFYEYARVAFLRRVDNQLHGRPDWDAGGILENTNTPAIILSYSRPHLFRKVISTTE